MAGETVFRKYRPDVTIEEDFLIDRGRMLGSLSWYARAVDQNDGNDSKSRKISHFCH
jgi:hypothetical protein